MQLPLLIFTDVEPDDQLALWILERRGLLAGATVVVTENDAAAIRRKCAMVRGRHNVANFAGATSERPRDFHHSEKYCMPEPFVWPERAPRAVVCLAPPRDLLAAPHGYFAASELWIYGGFNFREVTQTGFEVPRLLRAFGRAHVFERRHALPAASFFERAPEAANLDWEARRWNRQLAERLRRDLLRAKEPERSRMTALLQLIEAHPGEVAAADPLVAAFVGTQATRPCHIEFAPGASACTIQACTPAETNVYALFGVSEADVWRVLREVTGMANS